MCVCKRIWMIWKQSYFSIYDRQTPKYSTICMMHVLCMHSKQVRSISSLLQRNFVILFYANGNWSIWKLELEFITQIESVMIFFYWYCICFSIKKKRSKTHAVRLIKCNFQVSTGWMLAGSEKRGTKINLYNENGNNINVNKKQWHHRI